MTSRFLLALNLINVALDKLIYCGLIGQLFIGIYWVTPGAKWYDHETETVIQKLGYLGLIMLVYEGKSQLHACYSSFLIVASGLSTSINSIKASQFSPLHMRCTHRDRCSGRVVLRSQRVGLRKLCPSIYCCLTSLGTAFTILSSTGLIATRLETVTTTAVMLDDVTGLVMIQVISNIGVADASFSPTTVVRPVFVSRGFALGIFLWCTFCLGPIFKNALVAKHRAPDFVATMQFAFLVQTVSSVGFVAGASYAGTSSLFAAYLVGLIVSWFDGLVAESKETPVSDGTQSEARISQSSQDSETQQGRRCINSIRSIGFAIPITEMFQESIVWRGIICALLMAFEKMLTGLWLVRFSSSAVSDMMKTIRKPPSYVRYIFARPTCPKNKGHPGERSKEQDPQGRARARARGIAQWSTIGAKTQLYSIVPLTRGIRYPPRLLNRRRQSGYPPKSLSLSLYPASILGLAMVARGKVGYLIASLSQSQGIFSAGTEETETSETYLVIIWAITICTCIGPVCVGTLVRRVKKLQGTRGSYGADPLGIWGI
ncbi:hypothetical protein N7513_005220 [Penicillium frequentans]|nr:hypothetical protein N7513_005220 [Penicillium glabrum]